MTLSTYFDTTRINIVFVAFCAAVLATALMLTPTTESASKPVEIIRHILVEAPPPPKAAPAIPTLPQKELDCLARNVYFEAKNQSIAGQLAVALVTLNRASDERFPRTICGVISQGALDDPNRKVGRACQFSWYCNGKSNNPNRNSEAWEVARQVALDAHRMFHKGLDITNGATHFHATYVRPVWAKTLERVARIDDHIFYRWRSKNES